MESSEHVFVGNAIQLDLGAGVRAPAGTTPLMVNGPLSLHYGEIVALGGDFYGTPDLQPISSSSQPEQAFLQAWTTFAQSHGTEVGPILQVIGEEQAAIAQARAAGRQPSTAFVQLGDSLSLKWNEITGGAPAQNGGLAAVLNPGRYLNLAFVNMDHFGKDAVTAYRAGHTGAMQQAAQLRGRDLSQPAMQQALLRCYAVNAFADHFLSDLFAAGHLRTPRRPLYNMTLSSKQESGRLARFMHNEDNSDGVWVTNARGDEWIAYGDGKELDDANAQNLRLAIEAVQASADEVGRAAATGEVAANPAALQLTPNLDAFVAKPVQGGSKNHAPVFWADGDGHDPRTGYVYRRGGPDPIGVLQLNPPFKWLDKNDYNFSYGWSAKLMLATLLISDLLPTT